MTKADLRRAAHDRSIDQPCEGSTTFSISALKAPARRSSFAGLGGPVVA
jgi:hypothetical protein